MADRFHPETRDRQRTMLRTALGPAIASALDDAAVIEVMVNPDGRLWLDVRSRDEMVGMKPEPFGF